jgi:hypothetical protein
MGRNPRPSPISEGEDLKKAATGLALACLLAGGSVAEAKTVSYKGKTSSGTKITFKRKGNKVSKVRTTLSTICIETTGSGLTRAGSELYRPPGRFKLGKTRKVKKLQPAALNQGIKATKNYTVKVRKSGRRKIKGKLKLSYGFLIPDLFRSLPYTYVCSASHTFTAKPR